MNKTITKLAYLNGQLQTILELQLFLQNMCNKLKDEIAEEELENK